MSKNSTLKLWDHLLKKEDTSSDRSAHKILSKIKEGPKKEIINTILAYAGSVEAIRLKSNDRIIISLN